MLLRLAAGPGAVRRQELGQHPVAVAVAVDQPGERRRYLRREPIIARPQTALYQLQRFAARNRALVYAVGALMLVLVAGLASTAIFAYREYRQRGLAESRFEALRSLR